MPNRPLLIDLRHPLVLKANALFLLTREDGALPPDAPGLGLYYRDTCYLSGYRLRLGGTDPLLLMSAVPSDREARVDLTNRDIADAGGRPIKSNDLLLRRALRLDESCLTDAIEFCNYSTETVAIPLAIELNSTFDSIFVLRGAEPELRGTPHVPEWDGNELVFAQSGADGVRRALVATFSLPAVIAPRTVGHTGVHVEVRIAPQQRTELVVTLRIDEQGQASAPPVNTRASTDPAHVETSSDELNSVVSRSLSDIRLLDLRRGAHSFTAAGIPWFVGLFGRDSLWPVIQCIAFDPGLAVRTASAVADWQGEKDDAKTKEQPGKILHELRAGELAHLHEVPQTPSYASIDSTLLFLIAIATHAEWTGSLDLFTALRSHVDRALAWLERESARSPAGYLAYEGTNPDGEPVNQGWRDSGTGVLREDGAYPEPPLALIEVQGYAYKARNMVANLLRRAGEHEAADRLEAEAKALQANVQRDFWMEKEGSYCLGLERGGRQVASVTSNTAHALWTGIATPEHAARIAERIIRPDMFSGWGVRTLSSLHPRFSPLAYQQGSVWPFDSSLIVSGLRRYGHDEAALSIVMATLNAAKQFRHSRLPEFVAGTQRREGEAPTHTPRADPLQAWSAGAVPFMLTVLLGLHAEGFERQLHIRRPMLPDGVDWLMLEDMRVAGASVSLRFVHDGQNVQVEAIKNTGVKIVVDGSGES